MKATVEEYDFHQRILARDDPVAFAALAEWLYNPLVQDVRRRLQEMTLLPSQHLLNGFIIPWCRMCVGEQVLTLIRRSSRKR